ncbi:hypothetical protein CUM57_08410 [Enterococcus faecalis]|nr:hypothetical protein CUM57_08410 [Enterococcus faecalis]
MYICNKVILGISSCFPLLYKVILSHYTVNKKGKAIILLVYLHTIKKPDKRREQNQHYALLRSQQLLRCFLDMRLVTVHPSKELQL